MCCVGTRVCQVLLGAGCKVKHQHQIPKCVHTSTHIQLNVKLRCTVLSTQYFLLLIICSCRENHGTVICYTHTCSLPSTKLLVLNNRHHMGNLQHIAASTESRQCIWMDSCSTLGSKHCCTLQGVQNHAWGSLSMDRLYNVDKSQRHTTCSQTTMHDMYKKAVMNRHLTWEVHLHIVSKKHNVLSSHSTTCHMCQQQVFLTNVR